MAFFTPSNLSPSHGSRTIPLSNPNAFFPLKSHHVASTAHSQLPHRRQLVVCAPFASGCVDSACTASASSGRSQAPRELFETSKKISYNTKENSAGQGRHERKNYTRNEKENYGKNTKSLPQEASKIFWQAMNFESPDVVESRRHKVNFRVRVKLRKASRIFFCIELRRYRVSNDCSQILFMGPVQPSSISNARFFLPHKKTWQPNTRIQRKKLSS